MSEYQIVDRDLLYPDRHGALQRCNILDVPPYAALGALRAFELDELSANNHDLWCLLMASGVATTNLGFFIERMLREGYVAESRRDELRERNANMQAGRGFLTRAELAAKSTTTDDLDDLLS